MPHDECQTTSNPFSAKFVRPGATRFIFPKGEDVETLVDRLRAQAWRGAIVGPHGSGKSTLLATLMPRLASEGKKVELFVLHDGQRRMPAAFHRLKASRSADRVLIVDGYEQLSWWSRWRLHRRCTRACWGLVVTSHRPLGLPELVRTATHPALAEEVVERLQATSRPRVSREEILEAFARHDGNLRETLFDLYDRYEAQVERGD